MLTMFRFDGSPLDVSLRGTVRLVPQWLLLGLVTTGLTLGCGASSTPEATSGGNRITLSGAGATFPAPLYERWFAEYNRLNPNVEISYQAIGSGGGKQQVIANTVDFGGSDSPVSEAERSQVSRGLLTIPTAGGALALTYTLPELPQPLRLSREVYSDMFLGNITNWNDPAIEALNDGVDLPDLPVTIVHRSDGSGTTSIFTNHMAAISDVWRDEVGAGSAVDWPTGIGAQGNQGVTAQVQLTPGALGYVELSYANENNLPVASLENRAGNFVVPSLESAQAGLGGVEYPADFQAVVADPDGEDSYPIVGLTWMLIYQNDYPPATRDTIKDLMTWALTDGQIFNTTLEYVPVPESVVALSLEALETIQ